MVHVAVLTHSAWGKGPNLPPWTDSPTFTHRGSSSPSKVNSSTGSRLGTLPTMAKHGSVCSSWGQRTPVADRRLLWDLGSRGTWVSSDRNPHHQAEVFFQTHMSTMERSFCSDTVCDTRYQPQWFPNNLLPIYNHAMHGIPGSACCWCTAKFTYFS